MSDDLPPEPVRPEHDKSSKIIRDPHPEVVRWVDHLSSWPADTPFPLTPLEAWYVMQGLTVKPAARITFEAFMQLPGLLEGGPDGLCLRQV